MEYKISKELLSEVLEEDVKQIGIDFKYEDQKMIKKETIMVAFSGGRTSAYMSWWLKEFMSHLYDFVFVYANTGLEHEKTLEFVNKCDKYFSLDLVWLEAVINPIPRKGTNYKIVNFDTAKRDNSIFMDMCSVYGLPNKDYPHCTRELKNVPMKKYGNDNIGKGHRIALGIRFDEFKRVKNRADAIYPLATIIKVTKPEILSFWEDMPFNLEIEEYYGNCVGCYKKSHQKLKKIAYENPNYFDAFIEMENKYSMIKTTEEKGARQLYRFNRTAHDVKYNLKYPESIDKNTDCAEECGSIFSDYKSKLIETNVGKCLAQTGMR